MAAVVSWAVHNFKSLDVANVAQRNVTALTGANSSGKSSLLQSLLMLGQSIMRGGGIVLNGPLVRLGAPTDVVRSGQKALSFEFDIDSGAGSPISPTPANITVRISLRADPSDVFLEATSFEVLDRSSREILFAGTSDRRNSADTERLGKTFGAETTLLRVTFLEGKRAESRTYLALLGVVPVGLLFHRNKAALERQFVQLINLFDLNERIPYEVSLELARLVRRSDIVARDSPTKDTSSRWTAREIAALDADSRDHLVRLAAQRRANREWIVVSTEASRLGAPATSPGGSYRNEGILESFASVEYEATLGMLSSIGQAITKLGQEVRYLGPLRDEPRVVHGAWDESMTALPVGIRGELTAEVLTRRRTERVVYYNHERKRESSPLPSAVAEWSHYLGIGDSIKVLDLGKLGRGVQLQVDGVHRDLTTIGVGASQLLPVIVAGLSVSPRTQLLVEQPELHLHPRVQSRLADFILFARPDIKWIVETHSEYLITRIRRRVAEGLIEPNRVQVLFAEQIDGTTTVGTLALSEYGDFERWPAGFFDAQDIDSSHIVAAVASRASKGTSGASNTAN